jgi:hypothetical protein
MFTTILKDSDDGVGLSGLPGFWILSIVRYFEEHYRTQRFGNWICFRPQVRGWETPTLLGPVIEVSSF